MVARAVAGLAGDLAGVAEETLADGLGPGCGRRGDLLDAHFRALGEVGSWFEHHYAVFDFASIGYGAPQQQYSIIRGSGCEMACSGVVPVLTVDLGAWRSRKDCRGRGLDELVG